MENNQNLSNTQQREAKKITSKDECLNGQVDKKLPADKPHTTERADTNQGADTDNIRSNADKDENFGQNQKNTNLLWI